MKGKRYTTEDKIRILREVDRGERNIQEENISEVSFHRWKKQFGLMEVNEARRLKETGTGEQQVEEDAGGVALEEPGAGGGMQKKL